MIGKPLGQDKQHDSDSDDYIPGELVVASESDDERDLNTEIPAQPAPEKGPTEEETAAKEAQEARQKAKEKEAKQNQEILLRLLSGEIDDKKILELSHFITPSVAQTLDFNQVIKGEVVLVHLLKAANIHNFKGKNTPNKVAVNLLSTVFYSVPEDKINWNARFNTSPYKGESVLLWLVKASLVKKPQVEEEYQEWAQEILQKVIFKARTSIPQWQATLNWNARDEGGRSVMWYLLNECVNGHKTFTFAKLIFDLMLMTAQTQLDQLDWSASYERSKNHETCLDLLVRYFIRRHNGIQTPPSEEILKKFGQRLSRIPLDSLNWALVHWDAQLMEQCLHLCANENELMEKILTLAINKIPVGEINWGDVKWNERVKDKNLLSYLIRAAALNKVGARKILPLIRLTVGDWDSVTCFGKKDLERDQFLLELLVSFLIKREPWAEVIFHQITMQRHSKDLKWKEVDWRGIFTDFLYGLASGRFTQPLFDDLVFNGLSMAQLDFGHAVWIGMDWEKVIPEGNDKGKIMLQWLVHQALHGKAWAQQLLERLPLSQFDWKKINWQFVLTEDPFKGQTLAAAVFIRGVVHGEVFAAKLFDIMTGKTQIENCNIGALNYNAVIEARQHRGKTVIATWLSEAACGNAAALSILQRLRISSPLNWKGINWHSKIESGPHKDKTLWSWLLQGASEGDEWKKKIIQSVLSEVAASNFDLSLITEGAQIQAGPYKGKIFLECLLFLAVQGEGWAKTIVGQCNPKAQIWDRINWNAPTENGQTLFARVFALSCAPGNWSNSETASVFNRLPLDQNHLNRVDWNEKIPGTHNQKKILPFLVEKAFTGDERAGRILTFIAQQEQLKDLDWNAASDFDFGTLTILGLIVKSMKRNLPWAKDLLTALMKHYQKLHWKASYQDNENKMTVQDALPEPYKSRLLFRIKFDEIQEALAKHQISGFSDLIESLEVLARLNQRNGDLEPIFELALLFKKIGNFKRYCDWINVIPKESHLYGRAHANLAQALLENAEKEGIKLVTNKEVLAQVLTEVYLSANLPLRETVTAKLMNEEPGLMKEEDTTILNSATTDMKVYLHIIAILTAKLESQKQLSRMDPAGHAILISKAARRKENIHTLRRTLVEFTNEKEAQTGKFDEERNHLLADLSTVRRELDFFKDCNNRLSDEMSEVKAKYLIAEKKLERKNDAITEQYKLSTQTTSVGNNNKDNENSGASLHPLKRRILGKK